MAVLVRNPERAKVGKYISKMFIKHMEPEVHGPLERFTFFKSVKPPYSQLKITFNLDLTQRIELVHKISYL